MKRNLLIISAIACTTMLSCSKEPAQQENPGCPKISNELTINAKATTKTSLGNNNSVIWVEEDILIVFDHEGTGVEFEMIANEESSASFKTNEWTGKTPVYASCSQAGNDAACSTDGVLTVKLASEQHIHAANTYGKNASASVGKIIDNVGTYSIDEMKNVMGLLGINLKSTEVASIEVEAIGSENMAGFIDVNYAKMEAGETDFWTATASKMQSSSIILTPTDDALENDCFKAGSYYISLLPQTYSQGLQFTLKDKNNQLLATKTIGAEGGVTISRSAIKNTDGFLDMIDMLPETFSVNIVFNDKPFGDYPSQADQDSGRGEEYVYDYSFEYNGTQKTEPLTFTICRGYHTGTDGSYDGYYRYFKVDYDSPAKGNYAMRFNKAWGWIKTPAIAGRTLKSVTVSTSNTAAKQWKIRTAHNSGDLKEWNSAATATALNTKTFTFTKGEVFPYTSYYIWFGSSNTDVVSISLEYTKELPETE